MSVVESHTDISSADLNRMSDFARRTAKIGKRTWLQTVFQKSGVKLRPWVLSVSKRQSRALSEGQQWPLPTYYDDTSESDRGATYSLRTSRSSPVMMIS
jgi:hypothetical protein